MKTKTIFLLSFLLVLIYPVFSLFQLNEAFEISNQLSEVQSNLKNYQISIWVVWVVLICFAIFYKWTRKENLFFNVTYLFILAGGILFGFYAQKMVNLYNVPTGFEDNYTMGIWMALQNIITAFFLTGFLQAGVWWFTRRWHRRMK